MTVAGAREPALPASSVVLLALLALFWGVNWPAMKIALAEIDPLVFRTLCLGSGTIGLFALARLARQPIALPRGSLGPVIAASLLNITGWNVFTAYGLTQVPAGRAVILAFTMPLWAVLLSTLVLRDRLTLRQGLGLALGLGGLAVLLGGELGVLATQPLGALLIIAAAVTWAAGTVVLKRFPPAMPTASLAGWQLLIGGLPIHLATALFSADAFVPASPPAMLATLYNMLVCFIFCYWAWFRIVGTLPVAASTVGTLLIPVIGVLSSALALGEPLGAQEALSLALVVAALTAVLMPGASPRRA